MKERISEKLEFKLFKVIQELIANALKHSKANKITISLTRINDQINVIVEDDGIGFDPDKVVEKGGTGLGNVALRAAARVRS